MNSTEWLAYFRQNRLDRHQIAWHEGVHLRPDLQRPLTRSLACFQRGESSDGTRLRTAARRLAERTGDHAYREAIELFIAEEQEHSRLLANVLCQLNAPLLRGHWSDRLFRLCRHWVGFYGEISVLLMAEIVALKYYGAIRAGANDRTIEAVCDQILYDEKFHVRFHCEYLHREIAGKSTALRPLCWLVLTGLFAGASAVVAIDHRQAFAALGGSYREFLRDSWRNFAAARYAIFTGQPFDWCETAENPETCNRQQQTGRAIGPGPAREQRDRVSARRALGLRRLFSANGVCRHTGSAGSEGTGVGSP
jgi:hypothetical protein